MISSGVLKFSDALKFGDALKIGDALKFGDNLKFGDGLKFGDALEFGDALQFGWGARFWSWELGASSRLASSRLVSGAEVDSSIYAGNWVVVYRVIFLTGAPQNFLGTRSHVN